MRHHEPPRHSYAAGRRLFRVGPLAYWWKKNVTKEITTLPDGELLHHPLSRCRGTWCALHKPLSGPWNGWPLEWDPQNNIMYRRCGHGIRHPAAEQYTHWQRIGQMWKIRHDCDWCPCDPHYIDGSHEQTALE